MTGDGGLFGPDSVTWRIHAHPSMLVGGLRALLIQGLHPLAMAGVDQHSDYQDDPWGRLRRTTDYVVTTTFADTATAERTGATVRAVHRRIRGVDPHTGREYRADDPDLLAWIHNVEVHSFLAAYRRYGGSMDAATADRYVGEMVRAAELVGLAPEDVPATVADLRDYLQSVEGLALTPAARRGMRTVLAPPMPLALRPLWAIPGAAAIALMPRRLRAMYGIPYLPPADAAVRLWTSALFRSLGIVLPAPPPVREAYQRVRVA